MKRNPDKKIKTGMYRKYLQILLIKIKSKHCENDYKDNYKYSEIC